MSIRFCPRCQKSVIANTARLQSFKNKVKHIQTIFTCSQCRAFIESHELSSIESDDKNTKPEQ